jgi:hypothetical protein
MTNFIQIIIVFAIVFISCNINSKDAKVNSFLHDTARNELTVVSNTDTLLVSPKSLVRNYGGKDNRLFVFVGEKIAVEPLRYTPKSMDYGFKARYVILKKVYGDFIGDTIEFLAYDHYGEPEFSKYKNTLLYVSADSGTYFQQKYMYNDVYKTKDGRWAGTYAGEDYNHPNNKHTKIKPVKIDFAQKVLYPLKLVTDDGKQHTLIAPKPYFKTVGDSAMAIYCNYIDDLFILKRDGVLTSRGLFGNNKTNQ